MLIIGWIVLTVGLVAGFISMNGDPQGSAVRQSAILLQAVFWILFAILGQLIINANSGSIRAEPELPKATVVEQTEINNSSENIKKVKNPKVLLVYFVLILAIFTLYRLLS